MENSKERLMKARDLVKLYPCFTKRWLEQARINGGGPPFYRFARNCYYRPSDIDAWIESYKVGQPTKNRRAKK